MPFAVEKLALEGVLRIRPHRIADSRGYFVETYNRRALQDLGLGIEFVQDNEAFSAERGTLRGLHFQRAPDAQAKLVRVIRGAVFDVAVDLRPSSATYGRWCGMTLDAADGALAFVPAGFAHAYVTLVPDTLVAYKVDCFYNKAAEGGIRWNDPDIGIAWPMADETIKISPKDATLPLLRDLS